MSFPFRRAAPAVAALIGLFFGCTQDFDQFEPSGAASSSGVGPTASSSGPGGTGGTGGASSSSSSEASGPGSGSGGALVEDCLDGIDNDGDSEADCADADCTPGFECVDPAPTGWEGYFRINSAPSPNMAPPACPDGTPPVTLFDGPVPAECAPCTCGAWGNAVCETPGLTCWNNSSQCMSAATIDLAGLQTNGMCFAPNGIDGMMQRSCALTADLLKDPGSCPPSGGELVNKAQLFTNQDDVCGQAIKGGSGCDKKQVCVPRGDNSYGGPACIRKTGTDACPAGFKTRIEAAADAADDRACSACQCTVSGAACMGGGYTVYNADNCTTEDTPVVSTQCVNVSGQLDNGTGSIKSNPAPQPMGGTCTESGGEPSGAVTPGGVVTFCCP